MGEIISTAGWTLLLVAGLPALIYLLAYIRPAKGEINASSPASPTTTSRSWGRVSSPWMIGAILILILAVGVFFGGEIFAGLAGLLSFNWTDTSGGALLEDIFGPRTSLLMWVAVAVATVIVIITITDSWRNATKVVTSIPYMGLLWAFIIGLPLYYIGTGFHNWMTQPVEQTQTVNFYRLHTETILSLERRITVSPFEIWHTESGTLQGENAHPNGYWQCAGSPNPIFAEMSAVFISRPIHRRKWEYQFTSEARAQMALAGVTSLEVTHFYRIGGRNGTNPCEQMVYTGH